MLTRHTGDLLWFGHDGPEDGSLRWLASDGMKIDAGWNYQHVSSGDGGDHLLVGRELRIDELDGDRDVVLHEIYAITAAGELLWFRHDGRDDGSPRRAAQQGKKVGVGWAVKDIFSGSNGPS